MTNRMNGALFAVLAASMIWGSHAHQVEAQEAASGGRPAALEFEGLFIASDERAHTITVDTGSDKVVLTFNRDTAIRVLARNSPRAFYESRGGVLLSMGLARIAVGDRVHVNCEVVKRGDKSVCRKMTIESVAAPGSQKHTGLSSATEELSTG